MARTLLPFMFPRCDGQRKAHAGGGLAALRARWRAVLAGPLLAVATTALLLQVHPPEHVAQAQLLLATTGGDVALRAPARASEPVQVATQLAVLRSQAVAQRVVQALAEHPDTQVRRLWQADVAAAGGPRAWAEDVLPRRLSVQREAPSRVVRVSARAAHPLLAAAMAHAAGDGLLDTLRALQSVPAARHLAQRQAAVQAAADEVLRTQRALAALHRADAVVAPPPARSATGWLAVAPPLRAPAGAGPVQPDAVRAQAQAQAALQAARLRWGEAHPQVLALQARATQAAQAVADEAAAWAAADAQHEALRRQAETLAARASRRQHQDTAEQASPLQAAHPLQREALQALAAHAQLQAQAQAAGLAASMPGAGAQWLAPVVVPDPALRTATALALSLLLGAVASVSAVLLQELRGPRVRSRAQAVDCLQLPLLGVLAAPAGGRVPQAVPAKRRLPRPMPLRAPLSDAPAAASLGAAWPAGVQALGGAA